MQPAPFVFGKVPARGDFVRAGPIGPLVDDLDGWLQRALLAWRAPPAEDAPAVSFVFGRPQGTIAGAFLPSRDRSGRVFPLVAGGSLDGAPLTGALVASLGPFLTAAAGAAAEVVAGKAPDEALSLLRAPGPAASNPPLVEERGGYALADAFAPFRVQQAPRYGLSLPLPLDPSHRASAAGRWLDRLAATGPRRPSLSVLWSTAPAGARAVLFAGPPTADSLAYLQAGAPVEGVYEVEATMPADGPA